MSKVYVVQEVMKRDPSTGEYIPVMDFRKALEYGELVVCLPPGRAALSPIPTVYKLKDTLRNFCDDDYLLCVGDPSVIAIASAVACSFNMGRMKLLKWDKDSKRYIQVNVNLYPKKEEN